MAVNCEYPYLLAASCWDGYNWCDAYCMAAFVLEFWAAIAWFNDWCTADEYGDVVAVIDDGAYSFWL